MLRPAICSLCNLDKSRDLPGLSFQPCKVRVWLGPLCPFGFFGGQARDPDPDRLIRQERRRVEQEGCWAQGGHGAWAQRGGGLALA